MIEDRKGFPFDQTPPPKFEIGEEALMIFDHQGIDARRCIVLTKPVDGTVMVDCPNEKGVRVVMCAIPGKKRKRGLFKIEPVTKPRS